MGTFSGLMGNNALERLISEYRAKSQACTLDPQGRCEDVSRQFVAAARAAKIPVKLIGVQLRYLDEDEVAIEHYANVVDGKVVDFTFHQFDEAAPVPARFDSVEVWMDAIASLRKKYEYPELL